MKDKNLTNKKGFTLFELLVVISIIGVLVAVASVSYSAAQKRGRDAKRRQDMQAVQKAFEQYYAENNTYNATCADMAGALPGGLPSDPKPGWTSYQGSCTSTSYCYCAYLEISGTGNANNSSCSYGGSKNYYCVSNLQ